ncbi:unnamed protein product [Cuscuta epithymum]|uniref:Mediator of RNA polymerase II transcription subunit 8 n=1 Tax=Cuscuta epithymum TaxID=186058 RepID=A0AAV0E236_9ASTE|nr:unnamed protein product [Cuscuta epithymum]
MAGKVGAQDQQLTQNQPARVVEKLIPAVQQQLNLESVKTRAISLFKAISRILEDFDAIARTNAVPKWQDILGQFSMVNLELFNIVEDIKKVSKAFVVHPKNVNAENATILPVMLSSKLLPEMEMDDNTKREQLLLGLQNLSVASQIEKLKNRIDMIGAACESAEKVIADTRKAYFGTRQGPTILPTIDKAQAAKIQEQETLLRTAVNQGEGLRVPVDQRQITSSLPVHLVDILIVNDGQQTLNDSSGMYYQKSTPPLTSSNHSGQGASFQGGLGAHGGRTAAASPGGPAGNTTIDTMTASPLQYANSPNRSGTNLMTMNTPSPQQQPHQQQAPPQPRQKLMQLTQQQQQQFLAQQTFRQSPMTGLNQNQFAQLQQDLQQGQSPQKFQSMHGQPQIQFSQSHGGAQQFQGRQSASGAIQHAMSQNQLNQGNQLNRMVNQFSGPVNSALFNPAQSGPTSQMFGMSSGNRSLAASSLSDQMFNMGTSNPTGNMMQMQHQQQHGTFGNIGQNIQVGNGGGALQNVPQNHPSYQQQQHRPPQGQQ